MQGEQDNGGRDELSGFDVAPALRRDLADKMDCFSCGSPFATPWSTVDGRAWLCRECANLHGLGCP